MDIEPHPTRQHPRNAHVHHIGMFAGAATPPTTASPPPLPDAASRGNGDVRRRDRARPRFPGIGRRGNGDVRRPTFTRPGFLDGMRRGNGDVRRAAFARPGFLDGACRGNGEMRGLRAHVQDSQTWPVEETGTCKSPSASAWERLPGSPQQAALAANPPRASRRVTRAQPPPPCRRASRRHWRYRIPRQPHASVHAAARPAAG